MTPNSQPELHGLPPESSYEHEAETNCRTLRPTRGRPALVLQPQLSQLANPLRTPFEDSGQAEVTSLPSPRGDRRPGAAVRPCRSVRISNDA